MNDSGTHSRELKRLGVFSGLVLVLGLLTYVLPAAEAARPWLPGEPLPLLRLFDKGRAVEENRQGDLVVKEALEELEAAPADAPELPLDELGVVDL